MARLRLPRDHLDGGDCLLLLCLYPHRSRGSQGWADGDRVPGGFLRRSELDAVARGDGSVFGVLFPRRCACHLACGALVQRPGSEIHQRLADSSQRLRPFAGQRAGGQGRDVALPPEASPGRWLAGAVKHDLPRPAGDLPVADVFRRRGPARLRRSRRRVQPLAARRDPAGRVCVRRCLPARAHRLLSRGPFQGSRNCATSPCWLHSAVRGRFTTC